MLCECQYSPIEVGTSWSLRIAVGQHQDNLYINQRVVKVGKQQTGKHSFKCSGES